MNVIKLSERLRARKILLISCSGNIAENQQSLDILDLYKDIRSMNPSIYLSIITIADKNNFNNIAALEHLFDDICVISANALQKKPLTFIPLIDNNFDVIELQYHKSGRLIGALKKRYPKAKIIFSPMQSKLNNCKSMITNKKFKIKDLLAMFFLAIQEIYYCFRADKVLALNTIDQNSLRKIIKKSKLHCITTSKKKNATQARKKEIIKTYS